MTSSDEPSRSVSSQAAGRVAGSTIGQAVAKATIEAVAEYLGSSAFENAVTRIFRRLLAHPPRNKVLSCACGARPRVSIYDAGPEGMGPDQRFGWIVVCRECGADIPAEATISDAANSWNHPENRQAARSASEDTQRPQGATPTPNGEDHE
jgi:hypothetical protein